MTLRWKAVRKKSTGPHRICGHKSLHMECGHRSILQHCGMGLGANSTAGVAGPQTTGNLVVGHGGGTSHQSSATASARRPLNYYTGSGSGAQSQNHSGRGDARFDVTQRYTWSADHCGHSVELTRNTSTMRPLPGHHSSEQRKHFITYYRRTRLLAGPNEEDERLWHQEQKMKRPLVDILRPAEPTRTTRSTSQPPTHLVSYTTSNSHPI
jgi:hypothetical protein